MRRVSLLSLLVLAVVMGASAAFAQSPTEAAKPADKKDADCGCESPTPTDVLAIVNGVKIAIKDVDEPIKERLTAFQNQVVEARNRQLDLEINSRLLEAEARRLRTTPEKLLARDVGSKVKEPTDTEIKAFYEQNKSRIQGEFKDVKAQVIDYLKGQRQQDLAKKYADRLRARAQVKVLVQNPTPPASEADRARVFAIVNGKRITSGDLEDSLKALIASVEEQIFELRKSALDARINDALLEQEAHKRNVTTDALYRSEVTPRVTAVTEDAARKFYEENKSRIDGNFDERRAQIVQYLEDRERDAAERAFTDEMRKGAAIQVFLKPPDPPVFEIAVADSPWKGGPAAAVTIVEFTDYECPSCSATQPILEEVVNEYGSRVKLVARNFPLEQHKHAFKAAEAAEAAREQGKYWEYVAILFKNQKSLEVEKLKQYADQLKLDRKRFDAALDSGKFAGKVKRDLAEGDRIGVDATPTVFVNGRRTRDRSREGLIAAIEAALKESAKK